MLQPSELPDAQIYSARMEFAYAFASQPHVIEAWSSEEENIISIWAFVDDASVQTRLRVLQAQQAVIGNYADLEFDLYVFSHQCKDAFMREHRQLEHLYSKPLVRRW